MDELQATVSAGGSGRYHEPHAAQGKMFAHERIAHLVDAGLRRGRPAGLHARAGPSRGRRGDPHATADRPTGRPDGQRLHGQTPTRLDGRGGLEKQGIIRHGAKAISAVAEADVPTMCVVVRKAYPAGLFARAGPGFSPDATLALPTAKIAVTGPDAAVDAVWANKIAALPEADRALFVEARRAEYEEGIDVVRLAGELVVDALVQSEELRAELVRASRRPTARTARPAVDGTVRRPRCGPRGRRLLTLAGGTRP